MRYIAPRLLFLSILIILGCESSGPETGVPEAPQLHPQASTIPQQNAIRIEWDVGAEERLELRVYRSVSPEEGTFQIIATVSQADGYYEDDDAEIGITYYYRISVLDDNGNESELSDAVHYTLLEKPVLVEPADQAVVETTSPAFAWLAVSGASAFTVHVQSRTADKDAWEEIWRSDRVYPYQDLRKTYNDDNLALKPLEKGTAYRWLVDCSGGRSVGSQSRWRHLALSLMAADK